MSRAVAIRLVWTCRTALGSPVEPDVYIQNATSSDIVGAAKSVGSAASSTSSKNSTSGKSACRSARKSARSLALAPTTTTERRCGRRWRIDSTVAASGAATTVAAARLSANR